MSAAVCGTSGGNVAAGAGDTSIAPTNCLKRPVSSRAMNRTSIAHTFAAVKARDQIAMMPFVAAGFPDLATTRAVLPALESAGASLIEVGFPFSDPIADGPIIQEAFTAALAKKVHVRDVLDCVADV